MHDPRRHIGQLQQALSRDRLATGLLLGAGCPTSIKIDEGGTLRPLIPAIPELTKLVREAAASDDKHKTTLQSIIKRLDQGGKEANIEQLLTRVRTLREIAADGEIDGLNAAALSQFDEFVAEAISKYVGKDLPAGSNGYQGLADWIRGISRGCPIELFTTNYDVLIEQALESLGVPYFDGFIGSERPFFDLVSIEQDGSRANVFPARWARLWKLHGSINWWLVNQSGRQVVVRGRHIVGGKQRLIHPSHLKYDDSRRMPYLAMLDRLRGFLLKSPSALVTCGYSFSDEHINEVLIHGLESNPNSVCFVLLYGALNKYSDAISLAERRPNLNLLANDGALVATRRGKWTFSGDVDERALVDVCSIQKTAKGAIESVTLDLGDFAKFGAFLSQLAAKHSSAEAAP